MSSVTLLRLPCGLTVIECQADDRDDVSPSRLSFNLHIFIPSMMVSFPSVVDSLPP